MRLAKTTRESVSFPCWVEEGLRVGLATCGYLCLAWKWIEASYDYNTPEEFILL